MTRRNCVGDDSPRALTFGLDKLARKKTRVLLITSSAVAGSPRPLRVPGNVRFDCPEAEKSKVLCNVCDGVFPDTRQQLSWFKRLGQIFESYSSEQLRVSPLVRVIWESVEEPRSRKQQNVFSHRGDPIFLPTTFHQRYHFASNTVQLLWRNSARESGLVVQSWSDLAMLSNPSARPYL